MTDSTLVTRAREAHVTAAVTAAYIRALASR